MLIQSGVQQSSLHLEKGEDGGPVQTRWHFRVSQGLEWPCGGVPRVLGDLLLVRASSLIITQYWVWRPF